MSRRSGVTLMELLVALAILGLLTGVVAIQGRPIRIPQRDSRADSVVALRRIALAVGRAQTIVLLIDSAGAHPVTALPDGRIIGDSTFDVDPFTGRSREAR